MRHQVVAAVLRRDDQFLLCHRSPRREWYPDVWDLPGGHIEPGEGAAQALTRELGEELGIAVAPTAEPWTHVDWSDYSMDVWIISEWTGEIYNAVPDEHDEIGWFDLNAAGELTLAHSLLLPLLTKAIGA